MRKTKEKNFSKQAAALYRSLGQPARVQILLAIGSAEACVCHLEAALGLRQAYISQQLMALRQAGWVETRREGRNVFYRLTDLALLNYVLSAATVLKVPAEEIQYATPGDRLPGCVCPHCASESGQQEIIHPADVAVLDGQQA